MTTTKEKLFKAIDDLIQRRIVWEDGAYKQANLQLYAILEDCAANYAACRDDKATARSFNAVAEELGIKFNKGTSMALKIVRVVFGQQRQREFAYARVLKLWYEERSEGQTLTNYVIEKGGIESVRRNEGKKKTPALSNDDYRKITADIMPETPALASFPLTKDMLRDDENTNDYMIALVHCDSSGTGHVLYGSNRRSLVDAALAVIGKEINELQQEDEVTDMREAQRKQTQLNLKSFLAKRAQRQAVAA